MNMIQIKDSVVVGLFRSAEAAVLGGAGSFAGSVAHGGLRRSGK